uniref:Uncharacterized protein n=1 Tax=Arundo donax TaxID=35708 RepID=A0A0A9F703_ARUDO
MHCHRQLALRPGKIHSPFPCSSCSTANLVVVPGANQEGKEGASSCLLKPLPPPPLQ